ncbi:MAG: hypothetical protein A2268_02425 [Candidatus Raymondbacteria bacterium RifOxyA12_full_50_37]|uniref:histidine kinase n=1 Tax=Candidatus Raymondbacteria bacterium RIFOXYD12_FULL_49_13 TaxID=1817890 RepID=A0A1F7F3J8_UNCRA|nr:MAG: hypothetical protein A2268_02425 [Candidatus Raymondbacteria bacterium RifOxyA12_full_50_37]OGJ89143.1 MAG: hypothetical protein A2248_11340 [Candidatus Raymondbacteria bacterium RIFOXYA2_FULL_49_16]OGJ96625.1 MAG: hypothetical protein A2453_06455 [Candidatus Raymondbacteria bacterium RIFOXYC2_FULL_50_21]OGK01076.1 MAG: hypothetical protein A2519_16935 [Candidatus Raymondbacteria bacterium RIFOXYD12_FULL_49_13]OGK01437.1 MAG: hypothetical protein A2350_07745 [Candidatus Raymondbacteria 
MAGCGQSVAQSSEKTFPPMGKVDSAMDLDEYLSSVSRTLHDFRNTVHVLIGHATLLGMREPEGSTAKKHCDLIVERARQALDTIMELKAKPVGKKPLVDVCKVLEDAAISADVIIDKSIMVHLNVPANPLYVQAFPQHVQNAVLNLVVNAAQAMHGPGIVSISARAIETDGRYVIIAVQDSGKGISENILPNLFTPYFTTKGEKGTGLGLTNVRLFAESHGGTIHVVSKKGEGALFEIFLPLKETSFAA